MPARVPGPDVLSRNDAVRNLVHDGRCGGLRECDPTAKKGLYEQVKPKESRFAYFMKS